MEIQIPYVRKYIFLAITVYLFLKKKKSRYPPTPKKMAKIIGVCEVNFYSKPEF